MIKDNYIFVHIPKTAGESLEHSLSGYNQFKYFTSYDYINNRPLQHLTAAEIQRELGVVEFSKYYKFTFVRNPFSKCVSEYFWWKRFSQKITSFREWVYQELSSLITQNQTRSVYQKHNVEQYKFIFDRNGSKLINFIGRFENLQNDFDIICDKIGIPLQQLPHKNKTNHKHYTEYYDDETREIVAQKYARDIEYFGYEFGE